jgi:DNA-directed RNA polymerase specialized sigma subunit
MEACHFPDPSPKNNRLENLRWDTRKENAADVGRQGNRPKGSRHYAAKLTRYRAKAILALAKKKTLSQREIAELFGVSQGTVWQIFRKNRWEVANVNV